MVTTIDRKKTTDALTHHLDLNDVWPTTRVHSTQLNVYNFMEALFSKFTAASDISEPFALTTEVPAMYLSLTDAHLIS